MKKHLPLIFGLIVISGAFVALAVVNMREDLDYPEHIDSDVTGPSTWLIVGELLDDPPGLGEGGNDALTENQLNAALKEAVLITSGNADEVNAGLAAAPEDGTDDYNGDPLTDAYGRIVLDNANLPEFLKNMTPEERQKFVKFFRRAVMKEVERARKRLERKRHEEKRKKAIKQVQRRMKFTKDETDYIRRQERECWKRIKEITRSAKRSKLRKADLRRDITSVRKEYREELDGVLDNKRYTKYVDQVRRVVDPAYRNQADIATLRRQINSLQRQMSNISKRKRGRKKSPAPKR